MDNYCKKKRIANATSFTYHSILLANKAQQDFLKAQLAQAQPGDIITLTEPPATVNVVLVNEEMTLKEDEEDTAKKKAERKKSIAAWKDITLVKGRVVIPILPKRKNRDLWEPTTVKGGDGFRPSKIQIKRHFPLEPGFAITVLKAQGRTLRRVILALSKREQHFVNLKYAGIYVAMSRVRQRQDIRLLLHDTGEEGQDVWTTLEYVTALKPERSIKAFFAGYANDANHWDADLAYNCYIRTDH
jgi:hypothetical protein